jgi:hypothetical protein
MIDLDDSDIGAPSAAYGNLLTTAKAVLVEGARRRSAELPGLSEHLQDNVVVVVGPTNRSAHGWFQCGAWLHNECRVDEIFLNASFAKGGDSAEGVATTLLHEGVHVWNNLNGVRDCSNRGRYHNRRFAEVALQLGLSVEKDDRFGHVTVGLQPSAQQEFADLLAELRDVLTIARRPRRVALVTGGPKPSRDTSVSGDEQAVGPKYIFASCACSTARGDHVTFRMARGSWRDDATILCSACGSEFRSRVSTTSG